MAGHGRSGRPADEMFLESDNPDPDPPVVEPLRIHKRESLSPTAPTTSAPGQSNPRGGMAHYSGPSTFQLPPGASSSAAPLPYPDDRPKPLQQASTDRLRQPPYPSYEYSRPSQPNTRPVHSPPPRTGSGGSGTADPIPPPDNSYANQQASRLADRRNNIPKPLPASPGPDLPDKDGLFAREPGPRRPPVENEANPYPELQQKYWSPPRDPSGANASNTGDLRAPNAASVNRLASTASTSTTRAQRGSPPPPETPAIEVPGGGIEQRFAASGIAGTSTLNSLQAQNAAAAQRANQYHRPSADQTTGPPRPWTPTEQPGSQPHGPPTVYQGPGTVTSSQAQSGSPVQDGQASRVSAPDTFEEDFGRMNMSASPPPAYSSVQSASQNYPPEKRAAASTTAAPAPAPAPATTGANATTVENNQAGQYPSHPAFTNAPGSPASSAHSNQTAQQPPQGAPTASPGPSGGVISPPPLPEGWIAHLDPNSGQYYYIHLPTQSTQWEFPKGPTPLNLTEQPMSPSVHGFSSIPLQSPGLSAFGKPLASPGFAPPGTPGYAESYMGVASPTASGFGITGPPPTSGVDTYQVAPTNGVYFGPYLRYTNMDVENGVWLGSILLVTDAPQPPTIHIHQSTDLSPNPRQLKARSIHTHRRWVFYRYDIDLRMEDTGSTRWTYAITSHLGCTRYEFLVAGRYELGWRFVSHSGNDFSLHVNANERSRLGGVGLMWKDVMQKHGECGGFHLQLGLGGQIYADRLWKEVPLLKQWLAMSGKENRKNAAWTARHEEDVTHAYFHYYTSHFDQPNLREAFAQIPHVLQLDDHDLFDGFGSYPEYMQFSQMFKNIGRIGIEMYLLFQHHTNVEILRNVSDDVDLFTITGTGWHFIKYLGPAVVVVGPDCRSERNPHQVMAGPTYQGLFPKIANLPPAVQHCIWVIPVPLVYPRLDAAESIANTVATGKKAVTGAYNMLGKVTSSVAGVVGAKEVVGSGFNQVKKAVGKSGLMGGILSPFGDIDVLDELRDQWTHESKDLERTYLIRTLQGIAVQKSLRMTFISGAVNCCGAGLLHDPARPTDHKTMYQIISSSIVNAPPNAYVLKLLTSNSKPLYIPANGHRSTHAVSDTKEDMLDVFTADVTGQPRENRKLMGRRNYVACVAFDPEALYGEGQGKAGQGRLSLAVDFMVQGEGAYGAPVKYGPVIVPHLEFGR